MSYEVYDQMYLCVYSADSLTSTMISTVLQIPSDYESGNTDLSFSINATMNNRPVRTFGFANIVSLCIFLNLLFTGSAARTISTKPCIYKLSRTDEYVVCGVLGIPSSKFRILNDNHDNLIDDYNLLDIDEHGCINISCTSNCNTDIHSNVQIAVGKNMNGSLNYLKECIRSNESEVSSPNSTKSSWSEVTSVQTSSNLTAQINHNQLQKIIMIIATVGLLGLPVVLVLILYFFLRQRKTCRSSNVANPYKQCQNVCCCIQNVPQKIRKHY